MRVSRFRTVMELYGSVGLVIKGRKVADGIEIKACDVATKAEMAVYKRMDDGALFLLSSNVSEQVLANRVYPNVIESAGNVERALDTAGV